MLFRKLSANTLPRLSSFLRLTYAKRFSDDAKKDDPSESVIEDLSKKDVSRLLDEAATYSDANDKTWATSPYPDDAVPETKEKPKRQDPSNTSVILFPGQGVVKVGQVKQYLHFPKARELFEIANEILGYDLLKICLEGPQTKLNETYFNQPATVVMSLAALEKLQEERPQALETCKAVAGYSIGEITGLIMSSAITYEDGIELVKARGTAMHYASTKVPQGLMFAYILQQKDVNIAYKEAKEWSMNLGVSNPVCGTAIYLYTQAKILGGNVEALDFLEKNKEKYGLVKLNRLPVSGAFHTELMTPALGAVQNVLKKIEIEPPRCAVYSNCTAQPIQATQVRKIPSLILKQMIRPVKWEQIMQNIYNRPEDTPFPRTFDVCSNGTLTSILRRINSKAIKTSIIL